MSDFFRILRGLEIDETIQIIQGSGAPGFTADTDNAPVGSIYVDNTNGNIWSKVTAGAGPTHWSQTSSSSLSLYKENPVAPITPVASGNNAVAIGSGSTSSNQDSMVMGAGATSSGSGAIALGSGATASATNSIALGNQSLSRYLGGEALANGRFGSTGDAQAGRYLLRNITGTNVLTELYLDGNTATQRLVLPDDSTWNFKIRVTAHRTDATDGHAGYEITGVIYRTAGAATTTIQGAVNKTVIAESNTPWDVQVTADTTNGSLKIAVLGQTAKVIRWLALVETVEVTN